MEAFKVKGGKKLSGTIKPQGAKNEALQVISAVLLTEEKVIIDNIPNIIDVNRLIDLLKCMGVSIEQTKECSNKIRTNLRQTKPKHKSVKTKL
jgi:UDP-N-acetylglucosamine 1-carboxyvinyltransferase